MAMVRGREVRLAERGDAVAVLEPVRAGDDRDRLAAEVARSLGGRDDDGGCAVVLRAAVVEVERLGDPPRGVVLVTRQRGAVADRSWVALRVRVAGEHDLGEAVLRDAVVVHEPLRLHRADLRGRLSIP